MLTASRGSADPRLDPRRRRVHQRRQPDLSMRNAGGSEYGCAAICLLDSARPRRPRQHPARASKATEGMVARGDRRGGRVPAARQGSPVGRHLVHHRSAARRAPPPPIAAFAAANTCPTIARTTSPRCASGWMRPQAGDAEAQNNVGEIYERGLGDEPNYSAAIIWYQKAADQNYSRALFNLGTLYEQGFGVEQDRLKALNLYRRAWGSRRRRPHLRLRRAARAGPGARRARKVARRKRPATAAVAQAAAAAAGEARNAGGASGIRAGNPGNRDDADAAGELEAATPRRCAARLATLPVAADARAGRRANRSSRSTRWWSRAW